MAVIQFRRGTAAEWAATNPTLESGEPGFETDTGRLKVGNGTAPWLARPHIVSLTELLELFVPRHIAQETQATVTRIFELDPASDNVAPFQIVHASFENSGGKPYNNGVWIGFNAERYLQNGSGQDGSLGWHMGLESGYYNPDDGTYGPEWYLNYGSPDGTSVGVAEFRPLYVRLINADSNSVSDKSAYVLADIGLSNEGRFAVGNGFLNTLFYIEPDEAWIGVQTQIKGILSIRPGFGPALVVLDAPPSATAVTSWRLAGQNAISLIASTLNTQYIADKTDQPVLVFNFGDSVATRQLNARSKFKADGVIEAGSGVPVSTVTDLKKLGPVPQLGPGSNSARGVIHFGTGPAPKPGDAVSLTLPATFSSIPTVTVSAANAQSASLPVYAFAPDTQTIRIGFADALPADEALGTFKFTYQILG